MFATNRKCIIASLRACHAVAGRELVFHDISPDTMDLLIDWAYTHHLEGISMEQCIALLEASHKYDVAELQGQCERVLSSCVTIETYHQLVDTALRFDCQQLKQVWLSADCFACVCQCRHSTSVTIPFLMTPVFANSLWSDMLDPVVQQPSLPRLL